MNDLNADLRALLTRWGADPNLPPTEPGTGIEDSPRSHVRALPSTGDGTQPDQTAALAVTDLVYWTTTRQHGIGQIEKVLTDDTGAVDMLRVRPLLPSRSHSVLVEIHQVRRICSLPDLIAYIEFGAFP